MMFTLRKRRLKKVRLKGKENCRRRCHRRGRRCRVWKDQQVRVRRRSGAGAMSELGLPSEVMELIFERLPTLSLLRFTTVSKRWRDSIAARVAAPRDGIAVTEDWLLMITDGLHLGKLSAYNPAREQWHSIRLPVDSNNRFPFAVAADGNLVCMSDRCYRKFGTYGRVAVCDPLLKQWHELPPLRSWGVIQGMAVDPTTRAVKILATNFLDSDDGAYKLTCAELYDTSAPMQALAPSARWKMVLPPTSLLAADCSSVFCSARFVFLAPDYSLFAFDVSNESWIRVPTGNLPEPRRSLQAHKKLVVCNNSIFLFTIEVNSDDAASRNLVVWGLTAAMEWVEVAKAPPLVTSRFFHHADTDQDGPPLVEDCASAEHPGVPQSNGYSSSHHWTASGEPHSDVFRVWAVTVGKSAIFLKNTMLPQLLQVDLSKAGDARWRWVLCPHHVPLSARPFRFAL
ncbi:hypothetical protein KC19_1G233800 [Ceratodon purpureus]|uniref:F-box domain-containing protein n=1 Tax=Ceratodon purpureus TaxID=3225 RepID=A0A8T0JB48_CERPU|nr:hypothetical protein KC19_1G233800 [Ceratodon purpureus]